MNEADSALMAEAELASATPALWMAIGRYQSAVGELALKDDEVIAQREATGSAEGPLLESLKRSQRYRKWCRSRLLDFNLSEELLGRITVEAKRAAIASRDDRRARLALQ